MQARQDLHLGSITGKIEDDTKFDTDFVNKIVEMLRLFGTFLAVGAMMVIGIKYMSGSIEEKANYKKTMIPYLIGCILIFGASTIAPQIIETFENLSEPEEVGNLVLGLIQSIGTFIAVGILMILGIKYMLGSAEEKASYKKSMLPYLIGAILLFGAVNITAYVVETFALDEESGYGNIEGGQTSADAYIKEHTKEEIYAEWQRAWKQEEELKASVGVSQEQIDSVTAYKNTLYQYLVRNNMIEQ